MEGDNRGNDLSNVIRIDDERVREHLEHIVRGTVEETLNALLEAEADRLCNAGRYERKLETKAGPVTLKVPKLLRQTFETAIIERYRRRESLVEEALIEMYLAGVSVRRVEDITEALWGPWGSPGYGLQSRQEDLRPDRDLAEQADRGRASLPVPGRDRVEAHLGGRGTQRLASRRDLGEWPQLSRDSRPV